jgi:hypothetical protein
MGRGLVQRAWACTGCEASSDTRRPRSTAKKIIGKPCTETARTELKGERETGPQEHGAPDYQ